VLRKTLYLEEPMKLAQGTLGLFCLFGAIQPAMAEDEPDPKTLYDLSTEGSTQKVKAGEKGMAVLSIRAKPGAHVSDETPLKLEASGDHVKVTKNLLTYADSVTRASAGTRHYPDPKFEIPFSATTPGKGKVDLKLTFFICTEKLCMRQQRSVQVPVLVE
jgi:hypothetical protein